MLNLQLDPRTHPAMFIKTACILSGLVAFWYGAYFAFPDSFAVRVQTRYRCFSFDNMRPGRPACCAQRCWAP